MKPQGVLWLLAIGLAGLAIGIAALYFRGEPDRPAPPAPGPRPVAAPVQVVQDPGPRGVPPAPVDPVAQKEANEAAAARKRAIQAENKERIARGEEPIRPPVPRNAIDDRVDRLRLIAVSKDEDPNVRVRAVVELKSLGSERINEEVVEGVAPLLGSSPDASIRRRLCDALKGQTGPKAREGLLLRLIGDVDPLVRTAAADSLVSLRHDPEVRRTLETAKERDASELVRAAADRSLGR